MEQKIVLSLEATEQGQGKCHGSRWVQLKGGQEQGVREQEPEVSSWHLSYPKGILGTWVTYICPVELKS